MNLIDLGMVYNKDHALESKRVFFSVFTIFNIYDTVVDIGCGNTKVKSVIPKHCIYHGVDLDENSSTATIKACVSDLPFETSYADVVMCLGFDFLKISGGVDEVHRVLKDQGQLIFYCSTYYYNSSGIRDLLRENNFKIVGEARIRYDYNSEDLTQGIEGIIPVDGVYLICKKKISNRED